MDPMGHKNCGNETAGKEITGNTAVGNETAESSLQQMQDDACCSRDNDLQDDACCCRHKDRPEEEIRALTNRLSRIEGQIRGIRGMVEKGAYCPDILTQSAAVSAAMNSFNRELLASHIRTCVVEDIRGGDEETVDELVKLLQKLMK